MTTDLTQLTAIVFDWAGTTVDYGCRAPAIVFQEIFRRRGVEISAAQAREPMGMAKRDHIAAILAMPDVASAWRAAQGRPCQAADIDALYEEFLPLQQSVLSEHSDVIPGVPETVEACRRRGLKIGSSTGYTRALMEIVSAAAKRQGYEPDCVLCAEDAPRGRPAPYLLYEAAKRLDVYPLWTIVKVDDTPVGIEAGRNAGCWTVGVTRTGNCVGLSRAEIDALAKDELRRLCDRAAQRLESAGAHYTIESAADLSPVLVDIERRLRAGQSPVSTIARRWAGADASLSAAAAAPGFAGNQSDEGHQRQKPSEFIADPERQHRLGRAPMTTPTLNRRQSRDLDRRATADYGLPSIVLMENAGRGLADQLFELGISGPVAICCGKGNNGGDGFVLARHLDLRGASVKVLLWADPAELTGDAAVNFTILQTAGAPIEVFGKTHDPQRLEVQLADAAHIVDCLLGTGATGDPRPPLNAHRAPKLAVDVPSGLDCDTGAASRTTIRAMHTWTFVAQKPGFLAPGAAAYTGLVHVLDIGAPRQSVEACLGRGKK